MELVESSSIEAIGYDSASAELHVRFRSGHTYVYTDVPRTAYDGLMTAESIGRYFTHFIRPMYDWREE
jgi:hypothetical protein